MHPFGFNRVLPGGCITEGVLLLMQCPCTIFGLKFRQGAGDNSPICPGRKKKEKSPSEGLCTQCNQDGGFMEKGREWRWFGKSCKVLKNIDHI